MTVMNVVSVCCYCGKKVPDGVQPEHHMCCGEIDDTIDVPDFDENETAMEEAVFLNELERGYRQDRI